nr:hypothetical protein [Mycobacterium avium]
MGSVQDSSQASAPARPRSRSSATRTPAQANQSGPVAGCAGTGPNRPVRGGPSGGNQVAQPCP